MAPLNLSLITQQPTEGFYDSKVFSPEALPLRTFLPVHYEPNYAYPLIVYLHAHGSNEEQVLRYAPHISRRNYISISLRGMHATMVKKNLKHNDAYTWGPDGSNDAMVEDYIFNAIEKTQDSYNINLNRVFLAGFCEGATLAYRMAFSSGCAKRFASRGRRHNSKYALWPCKNRSYSLYCSRCFSCI